MPVNPGLAHLSDTLFTTAIAVYTLALVCYCAEYAFGGRGGVAQTAPQKVLVGAGGAGAGGAEEANAERADLALADLAPVEVEASGEVGASEERPARAERFSRIAVALTGLGLLLHAGSVVLRGVSVGRVPWGNMYEFSSAVGAVAVAAFLVVLIRQSQVRHLGLFVMLPVVLLMFLAGTVLYAKAGPLVPALRSYWLAIHVTAAILATGIFMVSFVATVLYVARERWDRSAAAGRRPTRFPMTLAWRLPEAQVLDRVAYRTVTFGFPIWTFGIIAGAIWAEAAWGRYWGWDPKETWAFIAWVIYAAYLHARATAGWRGVKAARINLLAFGTMTFNFFVVNIVISGLHSYAGLG